MTPRRGLGKDEETLSQSVRQYCGKEYVEAARARKDYVVAIRAGDVHRSLQYSNRLPLICSALGTEIFETDNKMKRIAVDGPLNGASTLLVFRLL